MWFDNEEALVQRLRGHYLICVAALLRIIQMKRG